MAAPSSSSVRKTCSPASSSTSNQIILPDLVSHCTFELRCNPHLKKIAAASDAWLTRSGNLSVKKQKALHGLKCGLLTAMTYPDCPEHELRVCCDYLSYLFHLDNISDNMESDGTVSTQRVVIDSLRDPSFKSNSRVGKMTKEFVFSLYVFSTPEVLTCESLSFWGRLIPTASEGMKRRFIHTFDLFFIAVTQQAEDRTASVIPDLESYISLRRDTSGCKPCWALIEYANGLDIPDEVMEHEVIATLDEASNDLVTWSNVSASVSDFFAADHSILLLGFLPFVRFSGVWCTLYSVLAG